MNEISKIPSSSKLITDNEIPDNLTPYNKQNINTLDYLHQTNPTKHHQSPLHPPTTSQQPHITSLTHAKNLYLDILCSGKDQKSSLLTITPHGISNNPRNTNDGITYFGFEEQKGEHDIDYLIKPKEDKYDSRFIGKHFQIKFNHNDMTYYLKDLGHGFGTFIKITTWTRISNNMLLNIGENYIVFTLGFEEELLMSEKCGVNDDNKERYCNMINVKIFSGNIKHGVLSFLPEKSPITMGRSQECEILIDDSMLSRVHCSVEYRNDGWFIIDGQKMEMKDKDKDVYKNSTNGTWVYAFEDTKIEEGMIFKANHNLFTCSFEES